MTLVLSPTTSLPGGNVTASGTADRKIGSSLSCRLVAEGLVLVSFAVPPNNKYSVTFKAPTGSNRTISVALQQPNNSNEWATTATANLVIVSTAPPPPTFPGVPLSLAGAPSNTTVALTWSAPASNGGSAVTNYRVYRNSALIASPSGTTYTAIGLTVATVYQFSVSAVNAVGEGPQTAPIIVTTTNGDTVPPMISNVSVGSITETGSIISWVLNEPGTGQVQYGTVASGGYALSSVLEASYLSAHVQTISGLTAGTAYHFQVKSADAAGNMATSAEQFFNTIVTTPPPFLSMYRLVVGPGYGTDSRNNYWVGGGSGTGRRHSIRFIASQSSVPTSIAVNERFDVTGAGYSEGTGGTIKIAIQEDSGAGKPSGVDLMSTTWAGNNPGVSAERKAPHTFASGVSLTAGRMYHLVASNTDPNPANNYISFNHNYVNFPGTSSSQRQPGFTNDLAVLLDLGQGGGWKLPWDIYATPDYTHNDPAQDTPVFDLTYANGQHDGQGYIGVILGATSAEIGGTSKMARQKFTVSGSTVVNRIGWRLLRTAGTGDLSLGLYTNAGALLASGSVAASTFLLNSGAGTPPASPNQYGGAWGTISFAPVTLSVGTTYYVRASAPAGTTYWSFCHQQQDPFDAAPNWGSSLLKGGMLGAGANGLGGGGEVTTNGSTWVDTYAFAPVDHGMYLANV